jgi:hypothetical protein
MRFRSKVSPWINWPMFVSKMDHTSHTGCKSSTLADWLVKGKGVAVCIMIRTRSWISAHCNSRVKVVFLPLSQISLNSWETGDKKLNWSVLQGCQSPYLERDQSVNTAVGNFITQHNSHGEWYLDRSINQCVPTVSSTEIRNQRKLYLLALIQRMRSRTSGEEIRQGWNRQVSTWVFRCLGMHCHIKHHLPKHNARGPDTLDNITRHEVTEEWW